MVLVVFFFYFLPSSPSCVKSNQSAVANMTLEAIKYTPGKVSVLRGSGCTFKKIILHVDEKQLSDWLDSLDFFCSSLAGGAEPTAAAP